MADAHEAIEPHDGIDPHETIDPADEIGPLDRLVVVDVAALTRPDVDTIEALARLQLAARRHRCRVALRAASPELVSLLTLTGLTEVVALWPGLTLEPDRVEPRRQAEHGEQPRAEEVREPGDAPG